MTGAIREIIDAADVDALRARVTADPTLARADVRFGPGDKHAVPPLHYVCDAVFRGVATQEQGLAMAEVLIAAGVDLDEAFARSGDTYAISAASLGAESVGLRLVELGVDVSRRGLLGATALHWAANMGLDRLALALLEVGAELDPVDTRYDCTPLQWALHAWTEGTPGRRDGLPRVASILVARGAGVPSDAVDELKGDDDAAMREALGARS